MSRADAIVEKGADRLEELSRNAASSGGVASRLAETLADDAAFLRRLKPSLIAARARGEAPTNLKPERPVLGPTGPQLGKRRENSGPNPWLVVGVALVLGIALAKIVDWRSHAHPRD